MAVICLNRRTSRYTGHNCFGTARVAGKIVVLNISETNAAIRVYYAAVNINWSAAIGNADVDTVVDV